MIQMNFLAKQKQTHRFRKQIYSYLTEELGGKEFGINRHYSM